MRSFRKIFEKFPGSDRNSIHGIICAVLVMHEIKLAIGDGIEMPHKESDH